MNDIVDARHSTGVSESVPSDLILDHSKYYDDLLDTAISEDQKRELLEILWGIMRLFVEYGFSIDVSGRATMEIFNQAARGDVKDEA